MKKGTTTKQEFAPDVKRYITNYSDFHLEYLGYSFIEKESGQIKTKLQVFLAVNANLNILNDIENHYKKINSKGWENGEYIYCSSTSCDCRTSCFRSYNKKNNALTYKFKDKFDCKIFDAKPL